ncbi:MULTISPECIES: hypothetical protein [Noviherbaspirillum]|uniref:hypothetical protein n=1 Tax=Noviherbaspirillum TaxID=1344552 RepID=UPI00124DA6ED|nr:MULTISPECIES: hypothetical protein [Noviherbaspirillum]
MTTRNVSDAMIAALADVSPDADFFERRDALGNAWFSVLWAPEFANVMLAPYQMAIAAEYVEGKISLAEFRASIASWPTFLEPDEPLPLPAIIYRRRNDAVE